MDTAHLHLVVNHLPIIFPIVGLIVLLTGFFTKSEVVKRTAYFIFVLGALASIGAMATGEGAEEAVEDLPGVAENLIKTHEEVAELFAAISYILGAISLGGIFASLKNLSFSKLISYAVGVLALVTLFFAQQTGNTGGQIRHTEIRTGNTAVNNAENGGENENAAVENGGENGGNEQGEKDEEDED